jgi:hypothetical protein
LVEDLHKTLDEARAINEGFEKWAASQPDEWKPKTISHGHGVSRHNLSWVSGRVDEYLDRKYLSFFWDLRLYAKNIVYVAAVWNAYRKNRLFILNTIVRCLKRLEQERSCLEEMLQVEELIADQLAAIPFHLAANVRSFAEQLNDNLALTIVPGKSIGGLLLMHPLYVASHLSVVNPRVQAQVKDCLSWISINMGIGEAKLLSTVR